MTMPRKGSRPITVNGESYRFMVRESDEGRRLRVTIEAEAHPGRVIVAEFLLGRCPEVGIPHVAAFVRHARVAGWNPNVMSHFAMTDLDVDEALIAIGR